MKNIIENIDWLITAFTFLGGDLYVYKPYSKIKSATSQA